MPPGATARKVTITGGDAHAQANCAERVHAKVRENARENARARARSGRPRGPRERVAPPILSPARVPRQVLEFMAATMMPPSAPAALPAAADATTATVVAIPNGFAVNHLIGPKGVVIEALQKETATHIDVQKAEHVPPGVLTRIVTITGGSAQQRARCAELVRAKARARARALPPPPPPPPPSPAALSRRPITCRGGGSLALVRPGACVVFAQVAELEEPAAKRQRFVAAGAVGAAGAIGAVVARPAQQAAPPPLVAAISAPNPAAQQFHEPKSYAAALGAAALPHHEVAAVPQPPPMPQRQPFMATCTQTHQQQLEHAHMLQLQQMQQQMQQQPEPQPMGIDSEPLLLFHQSQLMRAFGPLDAPPHGW